MDGILMFSVIELLNDVSRIIPITDEMKELCPSLNGYDSIFVMNNEMSWWYADRYGDEHDCELPDRNAMRYICSAFELDWIDQLYWTREVSEADVDCSWAVREGYEQYFEKSNDFCVLYLCHIGD